MVAPGTLRGRRGAGRQRRLGVGSRVVSAACALAGAAPAAAEECVTIEDFSAGTVGEFPPGWKLRQDTGRGVYAVGEEGGRRFLHAVSRGIGVQAAKEHAWDLARYPI